MDKIEIRKLRLSCILGIGGEERRRRQNVVLDLSLYAELNRAGLSDRLEDTVNYSEITDQVAELVEGSAFYLLEALAEAIAGLCLRHSLVQRVVVRIEKPGVLRLARSARVEISRNRQDRP